MGLIELGFDLVAQFTLVFEKIINPLLQICQLLWLFTNVKLEDA